VGLFTYTKAIDLLNYRTLTLKTVTVVGSIYIIIVEPSSGGVGFFVCDIVESFETGGWRTE
jgi:hypothetical protein